MREITFDNIYEAAYKLITSACTAITSDALAALTHAKETETSSTAAFCLDVLLKNVEIAAREKLPVCQDTGMAVFLVELGQNVHVSGGSIKDAINKAVKNAYTDNFFRKSVCDPLTRENTLDNTPAMITYDVVEGDTLKLTFLPKGFGSENMSRIFMLKPAEGRAGIINAVLQAVKDADSRPCPPIYVGVGIGGTFDKCAALAKHALTRKVGEFNKREDVSSIEKELLEKINANGCGAQGFGGKNTAIGVAVEVLPTHIAGLPVAVNVQCNCVRIAEVVL